MAIFDRDHWQEILNALSSNKLRTFLTAFGVFWGIFMLVVMLGSGNGLENGVMSDFEGATNSFYVWTRSTSKPYRGLPANRGFEMTNADRQAILDNVPEVELVCSRAQLGGYRGGNNVTRGTKAGAFSVMGDYPEIHQVRPVSITRGRFLNQLDINEKRKIAVIGTRVVDLLFEAGEEPIGEFVRVNGVHFKVVGIFSPTESGEGGLEEAQTIYVPFTTFQSAFNLGNDVGWFALTSAPSLPASVAEERVLTLLKKRHRIHPDDERALGHYNTEEEFNKINGLFLGISTLIWIVGIGTLAAGVIGVSNIMLVIVRERTNEIGIRRAVGATPMAITGEVLLEAIILTSVAGYAGLMLGMAGMEALRMFVPPGEMFANPDVSVRTALKALSILVVSGTLAGLMPARRAVRVSPVEALRAI